MTEEKTARNRNAVILQLGFNDISKIIIIKVFIFKPGPSSPNTGVHPRPRSLMVPSGLSVPAAV